MRASTAYVARAASGRKGGRRLAPNFPLPRSPISPSIGRPWSEAHLACASKPPFFASLACRRPMRRRSRSKSPNSTSSRPAAAKLLVAIKAAGLCHSDLSVIDGSRPRPTPMALGHEAAGIVEALGEGVTDLEGRRSCRAGVRAELRPLRPLRRRAAGALRAGGQGQRRRNAAFRRAAAFLPRRAGQPPPRRLGLRRPMRWWRANRA